MIRNNKFFIENFNYLLTLPYIVWLLIIFFYISNSELIKAGELDGLIKYGSDSYSYIRDAQSFLKLDFSNLHTSKLSYIFLITAVLFFKFSLNLIVFFQLISTVISSFILYLMCKKLFSKWVGLVCLFFFLTYLPIQLRNFYILTEILFINLSIILIYLFFFRQPNKIFIFLIFLFLLFLRPQSFLILLSIFITIIIFKNFKGIYNLFVKFFLIFVSFFLLIFFLNIGIQDYELINALSRGVIWGYSFDTNSICKKDCIQGFTDPDLYKNNIFGLSIYVKDNFLILLKVSIFKIFLFFTGWRPYYSNLHNIYVISFHLPICILFCIYFFKFKKLSSFETFSISYIILSVLFISFTFVDWSGRFIMYIIPFMMIYASKSLVDLSLYFSNRLSISK